MSPEGNQITFLVTIDQLRQLDELAEIHGSQQAAFDHALERAYENTGIFPTPGKYYDTEKYRITAQADRERAAAAGRASPSPPSSPLEGDEAGEEQV